MNPSEINAKLGELSEGVRLMDTFIGEKLTERQQALIVGLIDLFNAMRWQFALDCHKKIEVEDSGPIRLRKCGTPVRVRSCKKEHGDKTYFGFLIGEVSLCPSVTIDNEGTLKVTAGRHNPAIFIPELKTIVYGFESWWGEIKSEEELHKLITDETIKNVWYVKALSEAIAQREKAKEGESCA
jgi:hypothetical protein